MRVLIVVVVLFAACSAALQEKQIRSLLKLLQERETGEQTPASTNAEPIGTNTHMGEVSGPESGEGHEKEDLSKDAIFATIDMQCHHDKSLPWVCAFIDVYFGRRDNFTECEHINLKHLGLCVIVKNAISIHKHEQNSTDALKTDIQDVTARCDDSFGGREAEIAVKCFLGFDVDKLLQSGDDK